MSRVALWTALVATAIVGAQAQSRDQPDDGDKRLSIGVLLGFPVTGTTEGVGSTINTSETDPPTVTNTVVDSAGFPFIGGAAVRYDLGERFGVGGDLIYRRGGYDSVINISEQFTGDDD